MTTGATGTALEQVLQRVEAAASARDADPKMGLAEEVDWLHAIGAVASAAPHELTGRCGWSDDPRAVVNMLERVGRASLPLGRLYEGHVNALQLVSLYGSATLRQRCVQSLESGALWGVWGADGRAPVEAVRTAQGVTLHGSKIFCSGLGVVSTAVISAKLENAAQLLAVDVTDAARADFSQWRVSGMRATQSGGFDFEGAPLPNDDIMGGPSDYYIEPHFLGGMYRICAVQTGGLEAFLSAFITSLQQRQRGSSFLSEHRVGAVASRVSTAKAVTQRLAHLIAERQAPDLIAHEAVLGREAVERCVVEVLEIVERGVGTEAHREDAKLSLIRRDLSFYIRQAAVDERLAIVGKYYLNSTS